MPPTPHTRAINRVIDHISRNLHKPFTLEELAGIAHMSPFHFHRTFASEFRETPMKYIMWRRIESAAHRLLQDHAQSVSDVAYGHARVSSTQNPAARYLAINKRDIIVPLVHFYL